MARRIRRQADGWRREAEAHSDDGSDGSIRLFGGRERSEQPNERIDTAAPFNGGKRSKTERSVR
jgi:hypothetical protein